MNHVVSDLQSLLETYKERLYYFALKLLKDNEQAEDAVADVFIRLWKNPTLLQEVEDVQKYLYQAVRNACMDILRKKLLPTIQTDPDALDNLLLSRQEWASPHESHVILSENRNIWADLVKGLPDKHREIVVRRIMQGEKIVDIAARMGLSRYMVDKYYEEAVSLLKIKYLKSGTFQCLMLITLLQQLSR